MISWIQKTFQRHFKLVFALLLVAMVLPLVFIYSASGGIGHGDRETRTFTVFGVTLKSDQDQRLNADANVSLQLKYGDMLYYVAQQIDLRNYPYYRAAALQLADKLGLPEATAQDVKDYIPTVRGFAGQDGKFDPQRYQQIVDSIQSRQSGDRGELARVLADDWRVASVERLIGGPGYILDSELKDMLARGDTKWSVQVATVDLSKITAPREPSEDELRKWFDANPSRYQVPERTRVQYVEFRAEDFAAQVKPSESEIADYFEKNKANYHAPTPTPPPPAEGQAPAQPPAQPAEPTLDQVRDQVVRDLVKAESRRLATKAANDFAYALYQQAEKTKEGSSATLDMFTEFANASHLTIKSPAPFSFNQPPPDTGWSQQVLNQATQLTDKKPVSDVVSSGDNSYVLCFVERLPSYVPDFTAVRDRVLADVKEDLRQKAVTARGEELRRQLADAVKSGSSFVEAAKAAGLETKSWENFTLRTPPKDIDYTVMSRLEDLKVNEVSPMEVEGPHGTLALVTSRQVPEVASTSDQFEQARQNMMRSVSQLTAQDVLNDMVTRELAAAGLTPDQS